MLDALGNQICPGAFVVYPSRYSSSLWMNVALVLAVAENKVRVRRLELTAAQNFDGPLAESTVTVVSRMVCVNAGTLPLKLRVRLEHGA